MPPLFPLFSGPLVQIKWWEPSVHPPVPSQLDPITSNPWYHNPHLGAPDFVTLSLPIWRAAVPHIFQLCHRVRGQNFILIDHMSDMPFSESCSKYYVCTQGYIFFQKSFILDFNFHYQKFYPLKNFIWQKDTIKEYLALLQPIEEQNSLPSIVSILKCYYNLPHFSLNRQ